MRRLDLAASFCLLSFIPVFDYVCSQPSLAPQLRAAARHPAPGPGWPRPHRVHDEDPDRARLLLHHHRRWVLWLCVQGRVRCTGGCRGVPCCQQPHACTRQQMLGCLPLSPAAGHRSRGCGLVTGVQSGKSCATSRRSWATWRWTTSRHVVVRLYSWTLGCRCLRQMSAAIPHGFRHAKVTNQHLLALFAIYPAASRSCRRPSTPPPWRRPLSSQTARCG